MRKLLTLLLFSAMLPFAALCISGCASSKTVEKSEDLTVTPHKEPQVAEQNRVRLMEEADNADTIDKKVDLSEAVARDDEEIIRLKSGRKVSEDPSESRDKRDGFKSTKERTIVYGPVGLVLRFTEWLLTKLYIVHSS